jgi:hypothetical protein
MQIYDKECIVPNKTVAGNIKDFKQQYEIFYYPKADDLPDKIALYIYLKGDDMQYAKRSIYFSSHEQLKEMIFDLTKAYFYFKDKRITPAISRDEFRIININDFMDKLRKIQLNFWREKC